MYAHRLSNSLIYGTHLHIACLMGHSQRDRILQLPEPLAERTVFIRRMVNERQQGFNLQSKETNLARRGLMDVVRLETK